MTSSYPSDATENAVQANIVATGSGSGGGTTGVLWGVGSKPVPGCATPNGTLLNIWDCNGGSN